MVPHNPRRRRTALRRTHRLESPGLTRSHLPLPTLLRAIRLQHRPGQLLFLLPFLQHTHLRNLKLRRRLRRHRREIHAHLRRAERAIRQDHRRATECGGFDVELRFGADGVPGEERVCWCELGCGGVECAAGDV